MLGPELCRQTLYSLPGRPETVTARGLSDFPRPATNNSRGWEKILSPWWRSNEHSRERGRGQVSDTQQGTQRED